jgi:hypothetical protein
MSKYPLDDEKSGKPVFAKLKLNMTREQIKRNLIAALEKSGFTIQPSTKPNGKGGSS